MTIAQLERLAMHGADLPDDLTEPEQLLFLSLRCLYAEHRAGRIQRDQAHTEKSNLLRAFEVNQFNYNLFAQTAQMRNRLADQLGAVGRCRCPECRKVVAIFDGFERSDPV